MSSSDDNTKDRFTFYTAKELAAQSFAVSWLVDDVLPTSGFACVYGPSGVGKSFLCLDLAAALAEGEPWFGHPTRKHSDVVYVALEGQGGFHRRVAAWEKAKGRAFPSNVRFVFDSLDLLDEMQPAELGVAIRPGQEEESPTQLIVIDTLNRASPGADENSSGPMSNLIRGATILQELTGATVILVHHPGKDAARGLRGHSSLYAAMDTVIEVDKDGQQTRWRLQKSKDSKDSLCHAFNLRDVELGADQAGKAQTSCVIEPVENYAFQGDKDEAMGTNMKAVLSAANEILLQDRFNAFADRDNPPKEFPPGRSLDSLLQRLKGTLYWVPIKHCQQRTKEALTSLIRQGYLAINDGNVSLVNNSQSG